VGFSENLKILQFKPLILNPPKPFYQNSNKDALAKVFSDFDRKFYISINDWSSATYTFDTLRCPSVGLITMNWKQKNRL